MYSVYGFHHVPAKLCVMHVDVCGAASDHIKKLVMICEIYKIAIERTEILKQCLTHGRSY